MGDVWQNKKCLHRKLLCVSVDVSVSIQQNKKHFQQKNAFRFMRQKAEILVLSRAIGFGLSRVPPDIAQIIAQYIWNSPDCLGYVTNWIRPTTARKTDHICQRCQEHTERKRLTPLLDNPWSVHTSQFRARLARLSLIVEVCVPKPPAV